MPESLNCQSPEFRRYVHMRLKRDATLAHYLYDAATQKRLHYLLEQLETGRISPSKAARHAWIKPRL